MSFLIVLCMILEKLPILENFVSSCVAEIALNQISKKESIDFLIFLHGTIYQAKFASETNTFGWVLAVVPLVQSVCKIL